MEKKLFEPHYDCNFKRKVIEEYLSTGCSKMYLLRKYDIQFKSAIQTWMRVLGYTDPGSSGQSFKFGQIIFAPLAKQKSNIPDDKADLQKKVRELERQLEDEKLRSEAYARMIEKAEKELNISIKKKSGTR
jgi:Skp family chaperone for outer membrane proteins